MEFHLMTFVIAFKTKSNLIMYKYNPPPTDQFFTLFREGLLHIQSSYSVVHIVVDIKCTLSPHCCL